MKVVINSEHKYLNANIKLYENYSKHLGKTLYYYERVDNYSSQKKNLDWSYKQVSSDYLKISDLFYVLISLDNCGDNPTFTDIYKSNHINLNYIERNDPNLVKAVEDLQSEFIDWKVVEIPDDVEFEIDTQDGDLESYNGEFVAEKHHVWYWEEPERKE
jgi:hypothetical protein